MKPQVVSGSDLSLSKVIYQNILVSSDMSPYIDTFQVIAQVFSETYNIDPHTSRLKNKVRLITPLSCDLKPDITKSTSSNIVFSADLAPDI